MIKKRLNILEAFYNRILERVIYKNDILILSNIMYAIWVYEFTHTKFIKYVICYMSMSIILYINNTNQTDNKNNLIYIYLKKFIIINLTKFFIHIKTSYSYNTLNMF